MTRFTGLNFLLLGILLALYIFGFNLPLLPKFQVSFSMVGSQSEWFTAFSTLAAVLIALGVAIWGERLKLFGGYKSDIQIVNSLENIQANREGRKQGHTRLIFKNYGKAVAEEVEVYVNKIYDIDLTEPRDNFIPVPLSWTHDGRSRRNFNPDQYGYLDFCRIDDTERRGSFPRLVLVAGAGIPTYEDLYPYTVQIELVIFQKTGETKTFNLSLHWEIGQPMMHITNIEQN